MARDVGNASEENEELLSWREIRHYLQAPRRRPLTVFLPCTVVVLLSVVALFVLPKKYQSSTLIMVESDRVPESFVPRVATEDTKSNLWSITPEILSRTRLERVLQECQPYPDIDSTTRAVETMRAAVWINVSGNEGFTLSFTHRDPHKAQQVANRIATLFIDETIKAREEQVDGAVDFLVTQVAAAQKELEKKEEAVRLYKEQHMGKLPEQLQTNLATMAMLQREIQAADESLFFAREKHDSAARRLRRGPLASPDPEAPGEEDELTKTRRQLASLRARRYTDEHPDVESLRARIARLEAQLGAVEDDGSPVADSYSTEQAQLERAALEISNLEEKRDNLERQLAVVRANIAQTPRTEQELATLTRDQDKLQENYVALLGRRFDAQMAGRLERRWKGDRFRMLDPPDLPERPVFPKPPIILGLGVVVGLFTGLAVSLVAEYLDSTVKDADELKGLQDYPVVATIPHHSGLGRPPS